MNDRTATVLARLLDEHDLSQADLARATGVNQPTISRILNPASPKGVQCPSDKQIRPIASYFNISADQLRGYEDIDIESLKALAPSEGLRTEKKGVEDPIEWLQMIRDIQDPQMIRSLRNIAKMFSSRSLSATDSMAIEEITRRFLLSSPGQKKSEKA